MPLPVRFAFLDSPLPLAIAHRGGAREGIENTMAAFADAVALGYRYVETDVHATADHKVVAFHDRTLRRVAGVAARVEDLTWGQVAALSLPHGQRVPLLAEILATWPQLRVNIDVKADSAVAPVVGVLRRAGALDRVCLGAFCDRRVGALRHALGPDLCTSMGPWEAVRLKLGAYRPGGREWTGAACAQLPHRFGRLAITGRSVLDRAHELGLPVHVWTVDDPVEINSLLDAGVDGIMTDSPAVLRDVLVRRGQWHE